MDDFFNPLSKTLLWDNIGMGMSQPTRLNLVPGIASTAGGGAAGEVFSVAADPNKLGNDEKYAAK
jgi:hypothetical protein